MSHGGNGEADSDCSTVSTGYKDIKINPSDILQLRHDSNVAQFNNWLANLKTGFDENSARFSTSHQKIILILITLDKQLKTTFNSAIKDTLILSHH